MTIAIEGGPAIGIQYQAMITRHEAPTPGASARQVAIVYRYVHEYRAPFYERLRVLLEARGVRLRVVAGQPAPDDSLRGDAVALPWVESVRNRYARIAGREVCWQPVMHRVWGADLVVVEQATRLLANYALLASRMAGSAKVAFWGHGVHIRPHRASERSEQLKRWLSRRVDWWFAYTPSSVEVVEQLGFPPERITCVQNAVDTRALREQRARVTEAELAALRAQLGLNGGPVGVYCGALYDDKRLPFLVAACDRVRAALPGFQLVVIGDGPGSCGVRAAAAERPWMHVLGARFGVEKVRAMALGDALLLPGLVGLALLDGFALGLPLITTDVPFHSHEIEYLADGENGVMARDWRSTEVYAGAVARTLGDPALLARLRDGCRKAADTYTIEAMAENFAGGVLAALERPAAGAAGR
jgi:glycosyltransferase involved in cell wall biosynthesis